MMGNFIPAERAPVIEIGGHAFRIPAQLTWQQDQKPAAFAANCSAKVKNMRSVRDWQAQTR